MSALTNPEIANIVRLNLANSMLVVPEKMHPLVFAASALIASAAGLVGLSLKLPDGSVFLVSAQFRTMQKNVPLLMRIGMAPFVNEVMSGPLASSRVSTYYSACWNLGVVLLSALDHGVNVAREGHSICSQTYAPGATIALDGYDISSEHYQSVLATLNTLDLEFPWIAPVIADLSANGL